MLQQCTVLFCAIIITLLRFFFINRNTMGQIYTHRPGVLIPQKQQPLLSVLEGAVRLFASIHEHTPPTRPPKAVKGRDFF